MWNNNDASSDARTARRFGRRSLVTVALAVAASLGAAGTVAALHTSRTINVNPKVDSAPKSISTLCVGHPDRVVIGGAGAILNPDGSKFAGTGVVFRAMYPVPGFTPGTYEWTAAAHEPQVGGFAANWKIQTTAICAPKPAGYEVRQSGAVADPGTATVSCTGNKEVLGVGARTDGNVVIDDMEISSNRKKVDAVAVAVPGRPVGQGSITVYAICANPLAGAQRVPAHAPDSPGPSKQLTVQCPPGKMVHGVGYEINKGGGRVSVTELAPSGSTASVRASADPGFNGAWGLDLYAICANQ